jgi:hypothetical protein
MVFAFMGTSESTSVRATVLILVDTSKGSSGGLTVMDSLTTSRLRVRMRKRVA